MKYLPVLLVCLLLVAVVVVRADSTGQPLGSNCVDPGDTKQNSPTDPVEVCNKDYPKGTFGTKQIDVPDSASTMSILASRDSWINLTKQSDIVSVQVLLFDGNKWIDNYVGFTTTGGVAKGEDGNDLTDSSVQVSLVPGRGRKVQLIVDSKIDLSSTIKVVFK